MTAENHCPAVHGLIAIRHADLLSAGFTGHFPRLRYSRPAAGAVHPRLPETREVVELPGQANTHQPHAASPCRDEGPGPSASHVGAEGKLRATDRSRELTLKLRVLKLLPTTRYAQIAATLYISLNTVKTHLRSIYQKLGASSRSEAIERAVELRLL
jgi:LuxR family maltose regulon positive regulatory protein